MRGYISIYEELYNIGVKKKDPFVQWLRQNIFNVFIRVQIPYGLFRGFSLNGKITILHIAVSGSSPEYSKIYLFYYSNYIH